MTHSIINKSRKRTLEALLSQNYKKAKENLRVLAKKCYILALGTQEIGLKKGLTYEGDIYVSIAKNMIKNGIDKKDSLNQKNPEIKLRTTAKQWNPETQPETRFKDVIGLGEVKKEINLRMIAPYQNKEIAHTYGLGTGGGILLYGPPGTGKTLIARAVAGELDMPFFNINSADVIERSTEKTTQNIREIFKQAQKYERSVMFYDELETLVPVRPSSNMMKHAVKEYLALLDGFYSKKQGTLLVGATNRPWEIRPAILRPGRFSEKIYISLPDEQDRKELFKKILQELNISPEINYSKLAEQTKDHSGADIEHICEKAGRTCLEYFTQTDHPRQMQMADFDLAIKETIPTIKRINSYDLKKLQEFRQMQDC